jgi:hypothetical protein
MFRGLGKPTRPGQRAKPVPAVLVLAFGCLLLFLGILAFRAGVHNQRWLSKHGTRTEARLELRRPTLPKVSVWSW